MVLDSILQAFFGFIAQNWAEHVFTANDVRDFALARADLYERIFIQGNKDKQLIAIRTELGEWMNTKKTVKPGLIVVPRHGLVYALAKEVEKEEQEPVQAPEPEKPIDEVRQNVFLSYYLELKKSGKSLVVDFKELLWFCNVLRLWPSKFIQTGVAEIDEAIVKHEFQNLQPFNVGNFVVKHHIALSSWESSSFVESKA